MWGRYPAWAEPFQAGHLFREPAAWEEVFKEAGVFMPAKVRRWTREGYSVYFEKGKLRGSPKPHNLTRMEKAWAVKHTTEELVPRGVIELVNESQLPKGAVVCNVVVADKDGAPGILCWAGKRMNEALDKDRFRMDSLDVIDQLMEPGDWAWSLDAEKGYEQVPLKRGQENFYLFRLDGRVYRYKVMPLGLAGAPKHFSHIIKRILPSAIARGGTCAATHCPRCTVPPRPARLHQEERAKPGPAYPAPRAGRMHTARQHLGTRGQGGACKQLAKVMLDHCRRPVAAREVARRVGKLQAFRVACGAVAPFTRGLSRTLDQLLTRQGGLSDAQGAPFRGGARQEAGQRVYEARDYSGAGIAITASASLPNNVAEQRPARQGTW